MIFSPLPDARGVHHRLGSESGLVEIFVYPVMFGFRVRAGFIGNRETELDWCAGDDWSNVERLYSICKAILSQREESDECFSGLPRCSRVKPFFNDRDFTETVLRLAGDFEPIELEPLNRPLGSDATLAEIVAMFH